MKSFVSIPGYFPSCERLAGIQTVYFRSEESPVPFSVALLNLEELTAVLQGNSSHNLLSLLSTEEQKLFDGFTYPKRRTEWLGGRMAAKFACLQLLEIDTTVDALRAISIIPSEIGSPVPVSAHLSADELPSLSISHSDRFGVAMTAQTTSCGIDIQKVSDKTQRVADRFCVRSELQLLLDKAPELTETEQLTLLWSAKEALKKALLHDQPIIFQGVVLEALETGDSFTLHLHYPGDRNLPARVTAVVLEDCILAYCLMEPLHA